MTISQLFSLSAVISPSIASCSSALSTADASMSSPKQEYLVFFFIAFAIEPPISPSPTIAVFISCLRLYFVNSIIAFAYILRFALNVSRLICSSAPCILLFSHGNSAPNATAPLVLWTYVMPPCAMHSPF